MRFCGTMRTISQHIRMFPWAIWWLITLKCLWELFLPSSWAIWNNRKIANHTVNPKVCLNERKKSLPNILDFDEKPLIIYQKFPCFREGGCEISVFFTCYLYLWNSANRQLWRLFKKSHILRSDAYSGNPPKKKACSAIVILLPLK